jgi:hypothetical protein
MPVSKLVYSIALPPVDSGDCFAGRSGAESMLGIVPQPVPATSDHPRRTRNQSRRNALGTTRAPRESLRRNRSAGFPPSGHERVLAPLNVRQYVRVSVRAFQGLLARMIGRDRNFSVLVLDRRPRDGGQRPVRVGVPM